MGFFLRNGAEEVFLTAASCPRRDFYTHTPSPHPIPPYKRATEFCTTIQCIRLVYMHSFFQWASAGFCRLPLASAVFHGLSQLIAHFLKLSQLLATFLKLSQLIRQILVLSHFLANFLSLLDTFSYFLNF